MHVHQHSPHSKKVNGGTNMLIVRVSRLSSNKFQNNEISALNSGQKRKTDPSNQLSFDRCAQAVYSIHSLE